MVELQQVGKVYRERSVSVNAVQDVSFLCKPGLVTGILGPNGAGKTTLLRMISTVIKPTSGKILVNGLDVVSNQEKIRSCMGFISNNTGLYGRLTPLEVLRYFGDLNGIPRKIINERINYLSRRFGMQDYLNRQIDKLSTGMKQKVSIARSVLHQPALMVLDEPTSGLDVLASNAITNFIRESRAEGKTILLSTHIMREVERLCDEVRVIHKGRLFFSGSIDEFKNLKQGNEEIEDAFLRLISEEHTK
ncbi:MAG: ABC transporter ATP-binding protein [Sumerlaeia bacterium]